MALCMGCMREIGDRKHCPSCGFDNNQQQHAPYLPYGTVLQGRYIVGSVLTTNGESTRYISFDKQTGDVVIICEFLPIGLFSRGENDLNLFVKFENDEIFRKLKGDFISYYRTIAELKDFSALIKIYNIFQENETAYIIEEYQDLIPFEEYVQRSNGHLDWDMARPLFMPIISALEALHKRGIGHYAISPKNMYVTAFGKIKISGFATANERKRGTPLKSQLFSGCAAPEQYLDNFPIDNITEIYGFSATLFYALTGNVPASATERIKDSRLLMSTGTVKRLPPHVVTAIANGLNVKRENRITDFDELRSQLSVSHTAQAIQEEISRTASMNMRKNDSSKEKNSSKNMVIAITATLTVVILSIIGIIIYNANPFGSLFIEPETVDTTETANSEWTGPTVPNYVGVLYENALADAESHNIKLVVNAEEVYNDTYEEDIIVEQSPEAGSKLDSNGEYTISIKVSKGSQMKELPIVTGNTVDSIARELASLGFVVEPEYQYSDSYDSQTIIDYRDYQAGDIVESGSTIVVLVSKGIEPTEVE